MPTGSTDLPHVPRRRLQQLTDIHTQQAPVRGPFFLGLLMEHKHHAHLAHAVEAITRRQHDPKQTNALMSRTNAADANGRAEARRHDESGRSHGIAEILSGGVLACDRLGITREAAPPCRQGKSVPSCCSAGTPWGVCHRAGPDQGSAKRHVPDGPCFTGASRSAGYSPIGLRRCPGDSLALSPDAESIAIWHQRQRRHRDSILASRPLS